MKKAAGSGFSTATDLADWLVREAGPAVPRSAPRDRPRRGAGRSEEVRLDRLSLPELQSIHGAITTNLFRALGAEFGQEPNVLRRHRAGRGAAADQILAQAAAEGVISNGCNDHRTSLEKDGSDGFKAVGLMSGIRVVVIVALMAGARHGLSGCGRKSGLDSPYEAALQARKDAEENKEPLPPEPTKPDDDRPFVLDSLIE